MSKKNKPDKNRLVFSTDPNFNFHKDDDQILETLPAQEQKLRIRLETKHRGGKSVTLIENFIGKDEDIEELGKKLKNFCGTGGSVKDGEILVQGDHREKVLQWLMKNGFKNSRKM